MDTPSHHRPACCRQILLSLFCMTDCESIYSPAAQVRGGSMHFPHHGPSASMALCSGARRERGEAPARCQVSPQPLRLESHTGTLRIASFPDPPTRWGWCLSEGRAHPLFDRADGTSVQRRWPRHPGRPPPGDGRFWATSGLGPGRDAPMSASSTQKESCTSRDRHECYYINVVRRFEGRAEVPPSNIRSEEKVCLYVYWKVRVSLGCGVKVRKKFEGDFEGQEKVTNQDPEVDGNIFFFYQRSYMVFYILVRLFYILVRNYRIKYSI